MKKLIVTVTALLLFFASHSQPIQLYLGAIGGVGDMMTHNQLSNLQTSEGTVNFLSNNNGWSSHFKAQALLGIGRFRVGYQFLYNFASPSIGGYSATPVNINSNENTTYFNTSQDHFFGQYLLLQLAIINTRHFALVPGFAVGTFTGYKIDNTTGDQVTLAQTTDHRFSIGAELNAEIKFARRWTFLFGPNYYLFSMQDKANTDWHQDLHFFGIDAGIRVNLLKVRE